METIPTVGIVVFKDTKVLLGCHKNKADQITGTYGLPAGRVRQDESEIKAAIRELKEETGLEAQEKDLIELPEKYAAVIAYKDEVLRKFPFTVFFCEKYTGEIKNSEESDLEWIETKKLNDLNLLPNVAAAITQALKFHG